MGKHNDSNLPEPQGSTGGAGPLRAVTRRGFLKSAGVAAATAPLLGRSAAAQSAQFEDGLRASGPGESTIRLKINNQLMNVKCSPRNTLLDVLRNRLDMTGSKEVCARGSCGACTVYLDGKPVNSCLTLAHDCVEREVTTIEGLGTPENMDPVQAAFCKHDGLQCGYCTPGFVMSVKSLLDRKEKPTVKDVREACAGNICRCGTYNKIFEAALTAAGIPATLGNLADNSGSSLENEGGRIDGPAKVTGKAKYTADINLPNMAFGAIIFCPYGRARLKSVNEQAAKQVTGCLEVNIRRRREYQYCGMPTGHICAEKPEQLDDILAALDLEWEILPPTTDPLKAHEEAAGAFPPPLTKAGDAEEQTVVRNEWENAPRTVEALYQTQIQTHTALEPHCAVADFRGDSAEVWISSQSTSSIHMGAANAFGLPASDVVAHCGFVGGGFGAKFGIDLEGQTAIALSKKLRRPVKVVNTRKREHLDTGCRPGSMQYMKFALGNDGRPTAGQISVMGVCGPGGGKDARNPSRYEFGTVARSFEPVTLTTGGARAMRAPGHPQGIFAVDSFIDECATAAGIDPLEYRKRTEQSDARRRMLDVGAEKIRWATRPADGAQTGRYRRGLGIGATSWFNARGNAGIRVTVHSDGTVRVVSGTQDIGTGTKTVLVDVTADELGIDRALISGDTGNSEYPAGPGSGGSTVTRVITPAIRDAAARARAAVRAETGEDYTDTDSWKRACRKIPGGALTVEGRFNGQYWGDGHSDGVQFAEVEVDTHTGRVIVPKVVAIQSCGQAVNRLLVESQIIGGVIQGVSYALFEEKVLDRQLGCMLNANMEQYKITGSVDCPEIVPIIWAEGENLGARSLGEPPVIPTAAAIGNAVANALGARVRSLPISPEKVLQALALEGGIA